MDTIAQTHAPPYYAVIFTSIRTESDNGYDAMSEQMIELAKLQSGFLGMESARVQIGITVSYWENIESIREWKAQVDHLFAQEKGQTTWYQSYKVRVCKVERDYGFEK